MLEKQDFPWRGGVGTGKKLPVIPPVTAVSTRPFFYTDSLRTPKRMTREATVVTAAFAARL